MRGFRIEGFSHNEMNEMERLVLLHTFGKLGSGARAKRLAGFLQRIEDLKNTEKGVVRIENPSS